MYFLCYWQTSLEMGKIHKELNEKLSELRQLQMELNRRGNEDVDDNVQNLKRVIATIERENNKLKVDNSVQFRICCNMRSLS